MSYYPKTWHFSTCRHSEGARRRFFQVSPTGRRLQEELHLIWHGNALMSLAKERNIWNFLTSCPCHLILDKKKMGGWKFLLQFRWNSSILQLVNHDKYSLRYQNNVVFYWCGRTWLAHTEPNKADLIKCGKPDQEDYRAWTTRTIF